MDIFNGLKIFILSHKQPLKIWCVVQIVMTMALRAIMRLGFMDRTIWNQTVMVMIAGFAVSLYSLTLYLGIYFNDQRRHSWLRQLPFKTQTLHGIPLVILMGVASFYFFSFAELWRGGYIDPGTSVVEFLFLLPFLNFICIKRAKNPLVGSLIGAVGSFLILSVQALVSSDWIKSQYGLVVEAYYVLLLACIMVLWQRKNVAVAFLYLVTAILLPATLLLKPYLWNPDTLQEAILNLKVFPTAKSIESFKLASSEEKYWNDQTPIASWQSSVNRSSAMLVRDFFSDEETSKFLAKVIKYATSDKAVNQWSHSGIMDDELPIDPTSIGPQSASLLLATWQDKPVFCHFLPAKILPEYLDKVFLSESCAARIFDFLEQANFSLSNQKSLEIFNDWFVKNKTKLPRKVRSVIIRQVELRFTHADRALVESQRKLWERDLPVTINDMRTFDSLFLFASRELVKTWIALDRTQFETAMSQSVMIKSENEHDYRVANALGILCTLISEECVTNVHNRNMYPTFFGVLQRNLTQLHWINRGKDYGKMLLVDEILKQENWPKIQSLR